MWFTRQRQVPEGPRSPKAPLYPRAAMMATAAVVLVATGGTVSAITHEPSRRRQAHRLLTGASPSRPTMSAVRPTAVRPAVRPATTTTPPLPKVVSISPSQGAGGVAVTSPIRIVLSGPPRLGAPMPTLHPAVDGHWAVAGAVLTFTPSADYVRWATEHITVSAGLAHPRTSSFMVEGVPLLRAQQLLAELGYLPLRFGPPDNADLGAEPAKAGQVSVEPQRGTFTWRYPNTPPSLLSLWSAGQDNIATQGAVMQFESVANLNVDGIAGPQVWKALTAAVAARRLDPYPYDYLMVTEALPEHLVVWRDGKDILQTLANTGVPGAATPVGTWPVYERFLTTTMAGTDVNGYHYDVPNVPWVAYFNGGDAVHGYWRNAYGFPQSNGCVELPIANAQLVWPTDPIGTLVNVSS